MLLDEAPSRDIHDGSASFNLINQLLTLATNSIALCRGAHLGSLKLYQKKFLKLCFMKYESASNLRGPTSLEAQAADKRAWELIGELVNIHAWKLDDTLHEVAQVRADLSALLAPRAQIPKHLFQLKDTWRNRQEGKGNRPPFRGNGKGTKGKGEHQSQAEDPPERAARGGKGKKGATSSPGKWLSTLFMEGKQHTLCMRYQQGQCKDPSTCRYLHRYAVPSRCVFLLDPQAHKVRFSPSQRSLPGTVPRHHLLCQPVISVSPLVCRFWRNTFPTLHSLGTLLRTRPSLRQTPISTSALLVLMMAKESVFFNVQNSSPISFAF